MVAERNPNAVLGVAPTAGLDEIKAAFRRLAKRYHPDKVRGSPDELRRATDKMREVIMAFEELVPKTQRCDRPMFGAFRKQTDASKRQKKKVDSSDDEESDLYKFWREYIDEMNEYHGWAMEENEYEANFLDEEKEADFMKDGGFYDDDKDEDEKSEAGSISDAESVGGIVFVNSGVTTNANDQRRVEKDLSRMKICDSSDSNNEDDVQMIEAGAEDGLAEVSAEVTSAVIEANCPACGAENSCRVKMDRDRRMGVVKCTRCRRQYSARIDRLDAPVDVFCAWVDSFDAPKFALPDRPYVPGVWNGWKTPTAWMVKSHGLLRSDADRYAEIFVLQGMDTPQKVAAVGPEKLVSLGIKQEHLRITTLGEARVFKVPAPRKLSIDENSLLNGVRKLPATAVSAALPPSPNPPAIRSGPEPVIQQASPSPMPVAAGGADMDVDMVD